VKREESVNVIIGKERGVAGFCFSILTTIPARFKHFDPSIPFLDQLSSFSFLFTLISVSKPEKTIKGADILTSQSNKKKTCTW